MNHASVLSSTVPVFARGGHWLAAAADRAVPCSRTPRSRFVITNAVSARMTSLARAVLLEQVAVAILHRQHAERLHPDALIRERHYARSSPRQRRVARPGAIGRRRKSSRSRTASRRRAFFARGCPSS